MIEVWKPAKGYEGYYEVSNIGRIRNTGIRKSKHNCWRSPRIKKLSISTTGYLCAKLHVNGICTTGDLHRLMAQAFIPNSNNLPQVNHKDGNKLNNSLDNLEWVTAKENTNHALTLGLVNHAGESNGNAKLTNKQVLEIFNAPGMHKSIAETFGVSRVHVSNIKSGLIWSHITGKVYQKRIRKAA